MAYLRPSLENLDQLVHPLNQAELTVAQELARLDDQWTVYVQPRIGQDTPSFVAVHDLAGVCAIEVNDWEPGTTRVSGEGNIERSDDQGDWRLADERPTYQASRYRATIYDQYFAMPSDGTETTEAVRAAVVLPNFSNAQAAELLIDPAAGEAQRAVAVWGLDGLHEQLDQLVRGVGCAHPRPESILRLKQHLIASEVAAELAVPVKRSAGAARIEMNQGDVRIRRFRGPAGSSKSFGLAGRAARLASQNKRVLVLTFNVTLANHLAALVGDRCREYGANPTRVTCANFHSFCTRAVQDAEQVGFETEAPRGVVWPMAIVAKAKQVFEAGFEDRFDAVLIDEGQDFTQAWWNLLREYVVTADGEMLLVVDPTQDLYNKAAWADENDMQDCGFTEPWTEFKGSYRMPSDALALANEFAAENLGGEVLAGEVLKDHDAVVGMRAGSIRRWRTTNAIGNVGREVGREVVRVLRKNPSLTPRDVAFLCEYHHDGVVAVAEIEAAGYPVHHIFSRDPDDARRRRKYRFWPEADAVKGCTVHSFKGWQTKALVMGIGLERRSKHLAYVAMTRLQAAKPGDAAYISVISADTYIADFQATFEAGPQPVVTMPPAAAKSIESQPSIVQPTVTPVVDPPPPIVAPSIDPPPPIVAAPADSAALAAVPAAEPAPPPEAVSAAAPSKASAPEEIPPVVAPSTLSVISTSASPPASPPPVDKAPVAAPSPTPASLPSSPPPADAPEVAVPSTSSPTPASLPVAISTVKPPSEVSAPVPAPPAIVASVATPPVDAPRVDAPLVPPTVVLVPPPPPATTIPPPPTEPLLTIPASTPKPPPPPGAVAAPVLADANASETPPAPAEPGSSSVPPTDS